MTTEVTVFNHGPDDVSVIVGNETNSKNVILKPAMSMTEHIWDGQDFHVSEIPETDFVKMRKKIANMSEEKLAELLAKE